jgi:cell division protein FtsL
MNEKKTNRIFNIITALVVVAIGFFAFSIVQRKTKTVEVNETVKENDDVTDNHLEDTDSLLWSVDSIVSKATDENPIVETAKKQRSTMDRYNGQLVDSDDIRILNDR